MTLAAAALARVPPDRTEVLSALAQVPLLRAELDAMERALIDAARDCGVSWAAVAEALGLRSRQAAEQRRLRLGGVRDVPSARAHTVRQRVVDDSAGKAVGTLRAEVRSLANALWEHRDPAAVLARRTLLIALDAPPGSLVDLAGLALSDLAGILAGALDAGALDAGAAVTEAAGRVRAALTNLPLT